MLGLAAHHILARKIIYIHVYIINPSTDIFDRIFFLARSSSCMCDLEKMRAGCFRNAVQGLALNNCKIRVDIRTWIKTKIWRIKYISLRDWHLSVIMSLISSDETSRGPSQNSIVLRGLRGRSQLRPILERGVRGANLCVKYISQRGSCLSAISSVWSIEENHGSPLSYWGVLGGPNWALLCRKALVSRAAADATFPNRTYYDRMSS